MRLDINVYYFTQLTMVVHITLLCELSCYYKSHRPQPHDPKTAKPNKGVIARKNRTY